ncbi:haloacid dehalogenase [Phlyctema vagabunda]|uniref:Haloacid dehalogenase n=1 Tax=Phlyctema vagabunda TaxID=108571 RepID=A0ABR4PBI8_9HELO
MAGVKNLQDFKVLTFDVFGTLIDQQTGIFNELQPLLAQLPTPNAFSDDKTHTVAKFRALVDEHGKAQPKLLFREVLARAYSDLATSLELPRPSEGEAAAFAAQVGAWPAFPDTVPALQALKKFYKLVVLSNIDNESIGRTLSGPLAGAEFDAVYTAEMVGSNKPDLRNFEYLLEHVQRDLGIEKQQILHTANSLTADHVPAKIMGITSAWIDREKDVEFFEKYRDKVDFTWKFGSMGEMADAVKSNS